MWQGMFLFKVRSKTERYYVWEKNNNKENFIHFIFKRCKVEWLFTYFVSLSWS